MGSKLNETDEPKVIFQLKKISGEIQE